MKYKLFSIFDTAVQAYRQLLQYQTMPEAVRMFADACEGDDSPFGKHPNDYVLFEVGEFDSDTGLCTSLTAPLRICSAAECLNKKDLTGSTKVGKLKKAN